MILYGIVDCMQTDKFTEIFKLVDTRVLERRREKTNKKSKIVMFDFQEYRQDRPQGLKEKKTFKNLGLVAAQCNVIVACAYSLKLLTVWYCTYATVHGLLYIKTLFYLLFGQTSPK